MQAQYIDPFSLWKSLYTEMEPKMSQSMQKWLESEEYAAFSGQMLNTTMLMEQHFLKVVEQMLQRYNLPTMQDFSRIAELVIGLESKVDAIEERLIRQEKTAPNNDDIREQLALVVAQLTEIRKVLPLQEAGEEAAETPARTTTNNRKRTQKSDERAEEVTTDKLV